MEKSMPESLSLHYNRKEWLTYSFLLLFIIGTFLPSLTTVTTTSEGNPTDLLTLSPVTEGLNPVVENQFASSLKVSETSQEEPEAYFPNFLFYSIEITNAMIDHLYDLPRQ